MRADARRNYDRLLDAARTTLTEVGSDAPLEEVARRAGVGIGTLYRHFPRRLDLLEAVYRKDVEKLATSAERLLAAASPWDALEGWLTEFIGYATTKRALFHELVDAVGRDSELLTYSRQVITTSATSVLARAQEAGVARRDAEPGDLLRLVGGCTMMADLEPDQQARMLRIVLDGLRA
ncbi:MAG: TetR family transcriptional regulator [Propionibacteriales bacterium]|nr:TetR family transcriptional regulator [Propionibacteriales bacterium]